MKYTELKDKNLRKSLSYLQDVKEKLIKTKAIIGVFSEPLKNVTTNIKGQPNAKQSLLNVNLLRFKITDWISTIGFVVSMKRIISVHVTLRKIELSTVNFV